ncbi:MAG: M48 family metallopeptidase [Geminicoccaceae bacterium]|nr:M48 family metallopeptidase [Geminicoccaceae bacterium]
MEDVGPVSSIEALLRYVCRPLKAGFLVWCLMLAGCGGGSTGLGLDLVSDEEVEQMSLETWERIESETPRSDDARAQRTVDRIADRLLRAVGEDPGRWETVLFEGEQANAFALPGRKIGVYEGLFDVAKTDAQMAAVIGHEIAHVQAEHGQERVSSQVATSGIVQLVSTALQMGDIAYADAIAGALGVGAQYGVLLPYGRNQESEADALGLKTMAEAGYDPREAIALWRNMDARGGARPPQFLSTHPSPGNRIAALEERMPEALEIWRAAG